MRSAATALHLYESVKSLVLDRRNPMPVRQALKAIRPPISERTYQRRRKIAELMILDMPKFDDVVSTFYHGAGGDYKQDKSTDAV